jgi:hypothetical protein
MPPDRRPAGICVRERSSASIRIVRTTDPLERVAVPGDPERLPGSVEPDDTKLGPNDGTNAPHSGSGGDAVAVTVEI